jgi:glycerol-3-phosphate dehydrogenase (NAD(P)+)
MTAREPVVVLGGTPLGVALAQRLSEDGVEGVAVAKEPEEARVSLRTARLVVLAARPSELRLIARSFGDVLDGRHLVIHMVRGLVEGGKRASEVLREETPVRRIGVLGGPLAEDDLRRGIPCAAVVASRHHEVVDAAVSVLATPRLRIYRGRDLLSTELAAVMVDTVTIGCGLARALGFGESSRAVLVVRALRELGRLCGALGGEEASSSGLAGLGEVLSRSGDSSSELFVYGTTLIAAAPPSPAASVAETLGSARRLRDLGRARGVAAPILEGLVNLSDGVLDAPGLIEKWMALPAIDD